MADELVKSYGSWLLLVVVLGSFVDLCQALYLVKRWYRRCQRRVEARAMEKVMMSLHQSQKLLHKKGKQ
jgi:hypothetical protein